MSTFQSKGTWSLIPGPLVLVQPMNSQDLHGIACYPPAAIAESLLCFPGMRLLHDHTPSWWEWRARWESAASSIEVGMTLFEDEAQSWGGSPLVADCPLEAMESLWLHLQSRHPGVWLHDPDCTIHTHDSLRQRMAV